MRPARDAEAARSDVDVAAEIGGALARQTSEDSGANSVLGAMIEELRSRPTVLVVEDLHWADEATLDLLRLLGRRVEGIWAWSWRDIPTGQAIYEGAPEPAG